MLLITLWPATPERDHVGKIFGLLMCNLKLGLNISQTGAEGYRELLNLSRKVQKFIIVTRKRHMCAGPGAGWPASVS